MDIAQELAGQLQLPLAKVQATLQLLQEGNTLPFIARYRKEVTGGLDEEHIRQLQEGWRSLSSREERRQVILDSLKEQGVERAEVLQAVAEATTLQALEDLYLPFRPKRKTRASQARDQGYGPLAEHILEQRSFNQSLEQLLKPYADPTAALAGARDIVAEVVAETASLRQHIRDKALRFGRLRCQRGKGEDPKGTFQTYYDFQASLAHLKPHQILAIDRGEEEKVLSVRLELEERDWRSALQQHFRPHPRSPLAPALEQASLDGTQRLLIPAIERDVRRHLSDQAHQHAIANFASNLRGLLTQPPLADRVVLGLDPGYRTGCKLAVVDPTGRVLATDTVYLHREHEALARLQALVQQHRVQLVAIGNGTASRESEQLVARLTQHRQDLAYLMVSEAGASVYSASPLARAELPDLDVSLRGAVSIARRVLDPLAELVKIEPRSIGVGMYQHDLDQKRLDEALAGVVESVVNRVGVDLNTASPALLSHVAGIGPKLAEKIVAHRNQAGPFSERKALQKVSGLGPKVFLQAAGFLRVREGRNALDASAIHPESYPVADKVLQRAGTSMKQPSEARQKALQQLVQGQGLTTLAGELGVGLPTLEDILEQLVRPGRDPRQDLPAPLLRQDVLSLEDLHTGLRLQGTVRNVVDFGCFIDLGVKQDGLLHRSQLPRGTVLQVGQVLEVEVLEVDRQRQRIALGWAT